MGKKEFNMYGSEFTYERDKKNNQYYFTKHITINVHAKDLKEAKKELRKIIKKGIIF